MNYISYAQSSSELKSLKDSGISEVILSPAILSRYGKLNLEQFRELSSKAKELGLLVILEWDILINEVDFKKVINEFKQIDDSCYDLIRVQDVGALEYVLNETSKKIQFITENGNHNLAGLLKWESYIGARLDRLILSVELSKLKLKEFKQQLKCPIELLVLGRVLIFYSPRKLLSPLLPANETGIKDNYQDYIEAQGESEESPHKGFPLIQNRHGTFMFHIKDLFLLDKMDDLLSIGLDYLRIDLRFNESPGLLSQIVDAKTKDDFKNIKTLYGTEVIRGYFETNKSDVLFKKLKNTRLQRTDLMYVGEILEAKKSEYLAIDIKGNVSLKVGDELKFITPEGKEEFCKVYSLKDVSQNDCDTRGYGQLALMNYMGGIWTKSQVYLKE